MPEPELLLEYILQETACEKDMEGLRVLVTAGPTQEAADPCAISQIILRVKWDMPLPQCCARRGASVDAL